MKSTRTVQNRSSLAAVPPSTNARSLSAIVDEELGRIAAVDQCEAVEDAPPNSVAQFGRQHAVVDVDDDRPARTVLELALS